MADEIARISSAVPFPLDQDELAQGSFDSRMMRWISQSAAITPPWWSPQRDLWLRHFVADNTALKVAINTFTNKLVTIPWAVQARDRSNLRHVARAEEIENAFRRNSGSMTTAPLRGFKEFLKMFVFDYLASDNGAFALVMGDGPADGPIRGQPLGILHMDSRRCTRTHNPEYPVRYLDGKGTWHKLHYTRVVYMSNLPSPDEDMLGVGLCAVSCCLEPSQEIWDIYRYNAERMGSRPPRQILYIKTGGTIRHLEEAVQHWQIKIDNQGQTHFGGTLLLAPARANQALDLDMIDLNRAPENFSRKDTTTIDITLIAAAFGLDLRDLSWSLGSTGQTKADAEVQDRKGRGKGVGEFLETFTERFEQACLNTENWLLSFDNMDDEQDEQQALVRDLRSQGRERDLRSGVTTVRAEREMMWQRNEITQEMFEDMELLDGRLPNGLDVMLLFQSQDSDMRRWLDVGVADPTHIAQHDPTVMSETIHQRVIEVSQEINDTINSKRNRKARQALAALEKLRSLYQMPEGEALDESAMPEEEPVPGELPPEEADPSAEADEEDEMEEAEEKSLTKQVEVYDDVTAPFEQEFFSIVERAQEREIEEDTFVQAIGQLLIGAITALFLRGVGAQTWLDLSPEATLALRSEIDRQRSYVPDLAADIYAAEYPDGMMSIANRIPLWVNGITSAYYEGLVQGGDTNGEDPFLEWKLGVAEHCSTCSRLSGVVRRASEWRATPYRPRTTAVGVLECNGYNCKCFFERSDGPARGDLI